MPFKLQPFFAFCLITYCGGIFYLSHQPSLPVPMLFPHQDKLFHASAYGLMSWLALAAFRYLSHPTKKRAIVSWLFCALYGITDEWHQSFVEGRLADVFDWLADCVGAAIAIYIAIKLCRLMSNYIEA
jgi:VanZ family protein